ncbi:hypothetical protein [Streptomyces sp. NPDC020377]|uniref:hypothetical protein n=1 Tax=unclassified Streptomyces TaxID=2593676 RepID=UPI0003AA54A6
MLLPVGTVTTVDRAEGKIFVDLTKKQVKSSPQCDKDKHLGDAGEVEAEQVAALVRELVGRRRPFGFLCADPVAERISCP